MASSEEGLWLNPEHLELLDSLWKAYQFVNRTEQKDFEFLPSLVRTKGAHPLEKVAEILKTGRIIFEGGLAASLDELPSNWEADIVRHPGLPGGQLPVHFHDLDDLTNQNLVKFRNPEMFYLTPLAKNILTKASVLRSNAPETVIMESGTSNYKHPKLFISYSWDSDQHKDWVRLLAERLRMDGIDVILDQWHLIPGDQLTLFMESSVRESDFVIVVCTPRYKEKADSRHGGVGYEENIMTAELFSSANERKFIPVLREGDWAVAAPTWLLGKFHIRLTGESYSENAYGELIATLHGARKQPPPIGSSPFALQKQAEEPSPRIPSVAHKEFEDIKLVRVAEEDVTAPRGDGSRGSALYNISFLLSATPPPGWVRAFPNNWDRPRSYTTMHRPGIASVVGNKIVLRGTTIDEVEKYHRDTLMLAVKMTNEEFRAISESKARAEATEKAKADEHQNKVNEIAKRITFDS